MMTEDEINLKVKEWLLSQGFKYKGVLNSKNTTVIKSVLNKPAELKSKSQDTNHSINSVTQDIGWGQIPVPDGTRSVLIDHTGHKDYPTVDLIWIEAKGSGVGMSQLLEGFARMAYAVYHGGGRGLLACPTAEFEMMLVQSEFLGHIGTASERSLGLMDGETDRVEWLC